MGGFKSYFRLKEAVFGGHRDGLDFKEMGVIG